MPIKLFALIILLLIMVSCQKEEISLGTDAHDVFFLKQEDFSIPIQVHGNVASKKMLVIIHGGPGGSGLEYRDRYVIDNVEKEFAIAYFDQRFAGATQGNTPDSDISLFRNDFKKVLQLLKSRYGSDTKFYVMGHSWGGFLAPYFLQDGDNQNLVKGWIQVDGAHNYAKNDSLTREMLLFYGKREISANRNTSNWQEIVDFCNANPFDASYELGVSWNSNASKAGRYLSEVNSNTSISELVVNGVKINKIPITANLANTYNSARSLKIDKQAYGLPISENLYKLKLPTLLLWGRYDFVCPIGLTDDIKKKIGSKDITQKTFEKSGHSPMDTEPKEFWDTLINWVNVH